MGGRPSCCTLRLLGKRNRLKPIPDLGAGAVVFGWHAKGQPKREPSGAAIKAARQPHSRRETDLEAVLSDDVGR